MQEDDVLLFFSFLNFSFHFILYKSNSKIQGNFEIIAPLLFLQLNTKIFLDLEELNRYGRERN